MPNDHGVFAPIDQCLGERIGRVVGRQAGAGVGLRPGCHGRREQLGGLPGPGLAAVPNSRDANTAVRQETGEPLYILPPLVAKALALFKVVTSTECDLAVFTDALWRAGFRPECVGPRWQLALPVKPLSDYSHYRRLRNITR